MPRNKQKRKKDNGAKKANPAAVKIASKKIVYFILTIAVIALVFLFFRKSQYFQITTVDVVSQDNAAGINVAALSRIYKGRNIFEVDINSISSGIKRENPVAKDVVVKRVLPNRIEIDVIPRRAVATIKSSSYFPVDDTGMVLPSGARTDGLPEIIGFSRWFKPRTGEKVDSPQVDSALRLIDDIEETGSLRYIVSKIDVANHKNISFYIEDGIEVKIGGEDFQERLKMLAKTLENPRLDTKNIKYIDLRFKDAVIGPK